LLYCFGAIYRAREKGATAFARVFAWWFKIGKDQSPQSLKDPKTVLTIGYCIHYASLQAAKKAGSSQSILADTGKSKTG